MPAGTHRTQAEKGTVFLVYLRERSFLSVLSEDADARRGFSYFKLGFQYLRNALAGAGYGCRIFDQTLDEFTIDDLSSAIARERPAAVGFHAARELREHVLVSLEALRARFPDLPLLCGGPGAFDCEPYLRRGATAVVHGEGEVTLPRLLDALRGGRPLAGIEGISYRGPDGTAVRTPPRALIEDLDTLPFPWLDRAVIERNYNHSVIGRPRPLIRVMTSRGCPFRCTFCASPAHWGNRLRQRSVPNVIEEIRDAVGRFGVRSVDFLDDIFGWDAAWLAGFLEAKRRHLPKIRWSCNLHPLSFKKDADRSIKALADAGLDFAVIGLQTIFPDTQRVLCRAPAEVDLLPDLVAAARRHGVTTKVQFILGLPGDTPARIERTLDYIIGVRPNYVDMFVLELLEGSALADRPPDEIASGLDARDMHSLPWRFHRRFYLDPRVAMNNIVHIASKNPGWLIGRAPRLAMKLVSGRSPRTPPHSR